ncbi:hypothetical protein LCGC14_2374300, partial [marine sediment metagenome]
LYTPGRWCRPHALGWEIRASRGLLGRLQATYPCPLEFSGNAYEERRQAHMDAWLKDHPVFYTLRDYQQDAILVSLNVQWGRIAFATNAGKGAVITLLAEFAAHHELSALILCDELSVFGALVEEINRWTTLPINHIDRTCKTPPTFGPVSVAMVPTLARRIANETTGKMWRAWVAEQDMVLLDEADKATAPTWKKILANAKGSHWRLGFSGTFPDPKTAAHADLQLDELMGPILLRAKNADLIKRKISATPHVTLRSFNASGAIHAAEEDPLFKTAHAMRTWWQQRGPAKRNWVWEHAITNNPARHAFVASLIRPDCPTAIVVNRVAHGLALANSIPGAVFLDGTADPQQRNNTLIAFQQDKTRILIVTKILDRGTNRLGHTTDLIFASGEGSTRQTLQRIGRGLRRTSGKAFLRLVDVIDCVEEGDYPSKLLLTAARFIHKAARTRITLYQSEGFKVEIIV